MFVGEGEDTGEEFSSIQVLLPQIYSSDLGFFLCMCVWHSLNIDQQWQLPVSPSRNATLQTRRPTLSDPQYYDCLQVTLHNCLCLSIPTAFSLPLSLFFSLVPLSLCTSCPYNLHISHCLSLYFSSCSYSDSSAVLFLFCLLPPSVTFVLSTFSMSHQTTIKVD